MPKKKIRHSTREKEELYKRYGQEFLERRLKEFEKAPLSRKFAAVRKALSKAIDAWFFAKIKNKNFLRKWRKYSPF